MNKRVKKHSRKTIGDYVIFAILTLLAFSLVFPFYNAVVISLETATAYVQNLMSLYPKDMTFENYMYLIEDGSVWVGYRSTLTIVFWGLIFGMSITTLTAYGLSRRDFPGKKPLFLLMMFTMFFGGGMVPTYLMMKDFKLINTFAGVILLGGVSTSNIIVMKSGFESSPPALEEAAKIDGANDLQIFWQVMLPLQKPLLATFSLFTIVRYWNSWYWPMLLLNTPDKMTLQLVLRMIVMNASEEVSASAGASDQMFSIGLKMAAVMFTIVPVMCVYPFLQKHFAKGVMVGAIKM